MKQYCSTCGRGPFKHVAKHRSAAGCKGGPSLYAMRLSDAHRRASRNAHLSRTRLAVEERKRMAPAAI